MSGLICRPPVVHMVPVLLQVVQAVLNLFGIKNAVVVDAAAMVDQALRGIRQQMQVDQAAALVRLQEAHTRDMASAHDRSTESMRALQEAFFAQQSSLRADHLEAQRRLDRHLTLTREGEFAQQIKENQRIQEILEKPGKDRETKRRFINDLRRPIIKTDRVLTLGMKGMFKSTWLWLAGLSPHKPSAPLGGNDGTVKVHHLPGCVDSIGMNGWNQTDVIKQIVLLLRYGMPRDLIIFTSDRITAPTTSLALIGITNPMIVSMRSNFWSNLEDGDFGLVPTVSPSHGSGGRTYKAIQPESQLRKCYDRRAYELIKNIGLGTPLTHQDDLESIQHARSLTDRPFASLLDELGDTYNVCETNTARLELLFRFSYIYERKYRDQKDGDLNFVNKATLDMFDEPF